MTLRQAVIATLTYSDHFGFPLTAGELRQRLINHSLTQSDLSAGLKKLLAKKIVTQTGKFYHLPRSARLVSRRQSRARLSLPLLARAHSLSAELAHFPGLQAIYLTGSLAMHNTNGRGDIDFMLITEPGRLWTTRLLLTLYTSLLGLRRTPGSTHNSGKLCLNLYLTPQSFTLPPSRRSLYTAYELIQAVPLYDPSDTHSRLLSANPWIKGFLPNFRLPSLATLAYNPPAPLANFIEFLAYHLQLLYMKRRITHEYITPVSAFFHPHNPGVKVLAKLSL